MARGEACLRVSAIVVLVLTACLVAFDTQTKVIILTIEKKATYKDLNALKILVYVTSAAAGYNLLQICKRFLSACSGGKGSCNIYMAWITLLLDQMIQEKGMKTRVSNVSMTWPILTWHLNQVCEQMIVYITFGSNSAALEASLLALKGAKALQWMKVCNRFTRFCVQIGGAVLCGYAACILMAMISTVSAYELFRMYSPKRFLRLKIK